MANKLETAIKIDLYKQQLGQHLSEMTSQVVFEFDQEDNLIIQSNQLLPDLKYARNDPEGSSSTHLPSNESSRVPARGGTPS